MHEVMQVGGFISDTVNMIEIVDLNFNKFKFARDPTPKKYGQNGLILCE